MKNEVMKSDWDLSQDKLVALSQAGIIPSGTPKAQVQVFAEVARRHGLDPFTKEIHLVRYGSTYATIIGIQGMRGRAADTGLHAGTDAPRFDLQPDGAFKTMAQLSASGKKPITCTVAVYKLLGSTRVPFEATVLYNEFAQKNGKWSQMPFNMIAKVAESHALRKAFPRQINGLYIDEEMQQEVQTVEVETMDADDVKKASLQNQLRTALRNMSPEEAEGYRNLLNEKRDAGELTNDLMENILNELKQPSNA